MKTIGTILLIASVVSYALPLWVGWRHRQSLLWRYAAVGLFFDVLILLLKRGLHVPHAWAGNLFLLAEFLLLSMIYYHRAGLRRPLAIVAMCAAAIFFVVHTAVLGPTATNTLGATSFYCLYIIYALAGFRHLLRAPTEQYVTRLPSFWLHVGILIYSAGCILIFLSKDFLRGTDDVFFLFLWSTVFRLLNFTKNSFLAVALSKTAAVK